MARKTRGSLINANEVTIVHAVAKTARNLFLLGEDFATRTHNSHRKAWIVDILEFQCSLMAIDLLDFCVMDNHIHQVLRSRPKVPENSGTVPEFFAYLLGTVPKFLHMFCKRFAC